MLFGVEERRENKEYSRDKGLSYKEKWAELTFSTRKEVTVLNYYKPVFFV
jgi:hypothetical protein